MKKLTLLLSCLGIIAILACTTVAKETATTETTASTSSTMNSKKEPSAKFKSYWYNGTAEITSYTLTQARYGELRAGTAALIFVTEDFLPDSQVKADQKSTNTIPILKVNSTKKFTTGIYPYSIMQSTFYPVADEGHAIKISSSMQEWCGHVYAQLNNRSKRFEVRSHSYFQGEADEEFTLKHTTLENELWAKIRIAPEKLPKGSLTLVPSLEFCRLKHYPIKAYEATASLNTKGEISTYAISYPELNRKLEIQFKKDFPHEIEGWSETFVSGFGSTAQKLTTTATKKASILSPYWSKNQNEHSVLRDSLGLSNTF